MATNISDDCSPPVDFNLSSEIDEIKDKNNGVREKCLLCNNLRTTFYCKICVANGDFYSSTLQNPVLEKYEIKTKLQSDINLCRGRIKLLLQLIKKKNEVIKKTNKEIEMVREKNAARTLRLPRNKERVEKLEYYVANNMKAEIRHRRNKVAKAEMELRKLVQKNVNDLISYIFPISKIDAISKSTEELESTDTVTALAEATRTSYVRGKWVFMDSTGDLHYRIVAPTLPGSGDYSAYSDWVAANKNNHPGNEKLNENQAYNISAALCYTAQLVNLLAFYLDVLLPNRLTYSDFYSTDISDSKFYKKISKLNINILYLCFSQGIDTSLLNPKHTLCNLLHLVNHSNLGRTEPFEIDSTLVFSLENFSADLKSIDDCCSEDEDNDVPSEWEAIPLVPCPESSPGPIVFSTQQMPSMQATTSMAGDTIKSLLSCFETGLKTDMDNISNYWKNSIYELGAEVLNNAFDMEPNLEKIITTFLEKIIDSILNDDDDYESKNFHKESKAEFIVLFCQRKIFQRNVINHVITKIKNIKKMKISSDLNDKLKFGRYVKNSYYLLEMIKKLLLVYKFRYGDEKLQMASNDNDSKLENYNVLNIWKKKWNPGEGIQSYDYSLNNSNVSESFDENKWCDDLDDILIFSIDYFPILSKSLEQCSELAKDIASFPIRRHEFHDFPNVMMDN
ncbi:conserved hypothetical protein [Pediculus humanus corporis]|uniref:Beclin 1-associated autophagy-related key regulator n=1 Tax=Pediculus humanus subsp. corporis TaxID=121224 RepID=E0W167_PEDHC|nr:uncharacterized protein Phum_PHUM569950 [Pediculus humanus corporis]EEB19373.1 conserved hypothetical protein [Pediculus humanus corporis]